METLVQSPTSAPSLQSITSFSENSSYQNPSSNFDNSQQYNYFTQQDSFANYNATGNYHCQNCNTDSALVEDHKNGDLICSTCGSIAQERLIGTDAEYRVFSEDSSSYNKVHYSGAYNPLMEYSLTEKSKLERDEKEFLWDGLKNIDEILYRLYHGDGMNRQVSERAKELFQKAFRIQVEQKKGNISMKRSGHKDKLKNRQKFSRRKQFVVASLFQALEEYWKTLENAGGYKKGEIKKWSIEELSNQMDGIQVSKYSVDNCLTDLNLPSSAQTSSPPSQLPHIPQIPQIKH
jgi:uncharacterized Zn finger protein (UPF0148 family)